MKAKIGHTCDPGPVVSKCHFNFLGADYSLVNFRSNVRNGKKCIICYILVIDFHIFRSSTSPVGVTLGVVQQAVAAHRAAG